MKESIYNYNNTAITTNCTMDKCGDLFNPDNYTSQMEYLKSMTKYFNLDNPAPFITARSWCMMDLKSGDLLFAK